MYDPETARDFWHNKATGVSQWATPREALMSGFGGMGAIADGDGDEGEDDDDESTEEGKAEEKAREKDDGSDTSKAAWAKRRARSVWAHPVADGSVWEELKDPVTERCFFFNKETGVRTWDDPRAVAGGGPRVIKTPRVMRGGRRWSVSSASPSFRGGPR